MLKNTFIIGKQNRIFKKVIANTENKIKEINFNFELPDKIFQ
jgi:hypothetical protein